LNITRLKEKNKKKEILIQFNKKIELYTVVGGGELLDELRPGQEAWVWFEGCKKPVKGTPTAVMIHIFN